MSQNQYDMNNAFPNKWDSIAQHISIDHNITATYNIGFPKKERKKLNKL